MRQINPVWPQTPPQYSPIYFRQIHPVHTQKNNHTITIRSLFPFSLSELNKSFLLFIGCLFVCAVDSAVNEEGLEEEQGYEQELGDQDPGQESPEGWENGKCNPILWCMLLS